MHDVRNFSELLARLQNKSHAMGRLSEAAPGRIYSQSYPIGVGHQSSESEEHTFAYTPYSKDIEVLESYIF